jgi:hypothetical protein
LLPPRRESTNQTPSPAPLLCSYRSALHARPLAGRVPRCDPPRTSRRCETPSTVPGTSPSTPHAEPAGVRTYSRPVTPALSQHLSRPPGTALQPGAIHYARRGFCYPRACTRSSSAQAAAAERAWQTALLGRNSASDVRDSRTSETRRVRGNSAMQATEERALVVRRSSFDSCRGIAPDALKQSGVSLTS